MHAIITGASSGIGAALVRELHGAGATVTLVARREALLRSLCAELGERCHVVVADVATTRGSDRAPAWLTEAERRAPIDLLVNNAGVANAGPFASSDPRLGEHVLDVNLFAPIRLARAVVPLMLPRKNGAIVNVSSLAALAPPSGMAWYAGAKAGLGAFSEALGAELAGTGVHVLTVYPGPIDNGAPQAAYALYGNDSLAGRLPVGRADALARAMHEALRARRKRLIYPRAYAAVWWANAVARWAVRLGTPALRSLPEGGAP